MQNKMGGENLVLLGSQVRLFIVVSLTNNINFAVVDNA